MDTGFKQRLLKVLIFSTSLLVIFIAIGESTLDPEPLSGLGTLMFFGSFMTGIGTAIGWSLMLIDYLTDGNW